MTGKRTTGFSREEVIEVKSLLIRGTSCSTIGRMLGVSAETIGRIRRGATYQDVYVEGEEKLRAEVRVVARDKTVAPLFVRETEEEMERKQNASLGNLMRKGVMIQGMEEDDPLAELQREIVKEREMSGASLIGEMQVSDQEILDARTIVHYHGIGAPMDKKRIAALKLSTEE